MSKLLSNFGLKLTRIYLPILITIVFVVIFYHGLRWLIDYNLNWFSFENYLWEFVFPFLFSLVLSYVLLKRRIRIIDGSSENYKPREFLTFLIWIMCSLLILGTHKVVEQLAFSIIEVPNVTYVEEYENERFFDIANPQLNRKKIISGYNSRVEGKRNETFAYSIFAAYPFMEGERKYWMGVYKNENVSNKWGAVKKRKAINSTRIEFLNETESRRFDKDYAFRKLTNSDTRDGFLKAIRRHTNFAEEEYAAIEIFVPEDVNALSETEIKPFFYWLFGVGSLIILVVLFFAKLDNEGMEDYNKPPEFFKEIRSWAREIIISFKTIPVTSFIIAINSIVFVIGVLKGVHFLHPSSEELYNFGAATRDSLLVENYWQIVSSGFVHAGVMHIFYNMFGIWLAGLLLEEKIKSVTFAVVYMLAGIFSVITALYFQERIILVGASGAIYGLTGMMVSFWLLKYFEEGTRSLVGFYILFFGVFGIGIGFLTPNIANIAHLSGLVFGFVFGCLYVFIEKLRK